MDINLFTTMMRTEFLKSMQAVAEPAPYEVFTTIVPSTARLENYAWMTPAPGISKYVGHRRLAQIDQIRYSVLNQEYDGAMTVSLRDVEDDQIGGYKMRMNDLTQKAKAPFRSRLLMQGLANGSDPVKGIGFDGTAFFATAHNLGGWGTTLPPGVGGAANNLTFTSTFSADGLTHRFVVLVHNGPLKPLLYQDRKGPKFMTDAGTPQSEKAKKADYWLDLEAAQAFGYWWDGVLMTVTNTPGLTDLGTMVDACRRAMRLFTLPTSLPTDPVERVHEQTDFNPKNATIVCSTGLEQLFRHLLFEDRVGVSVAGSTGGITSNLYYRAFGLVTTGYLD